MILLQLFVAAAALVVANSALAKSSIDPYAYQRCMSWLNEHYKKYREEKVIDQYKINGDFYLRGNYYIVPHFGPTAVIGFECTYYSNRGEVIGVPNLQPFKPNIKKSKLVAGMKEIRVQSGHYACPDLKPFKQLSDEVEKGNFQRAAKMRFPPSCVWLEKGDTLFGPPLEESEYHSSKFLKMKLRDGSDVWVEKYKEYED